MSAQFVDARGAALLLDVDLSQVRRWVRDGRLTPYGSRRKRWFTIDDLQELDKTRRKHADRGKKLAKTDPRFARWVRVLCARTALDLRKWS